MSAVFEVAAQEAATQEEAIKITDDEIITVLLKASRRPEGLVLKVGRMGRVHLQCPRSTTFKNASSVSLSIWQDGRRMLIVDAFRCLVPNNDAMKMLQRCCIEARDTGAMQGQPRVSFDQ